MYSGSCLVSIGFRIRAFHALWTDFPNRSPNVAYRDDSPNPSMHARWFGLFPFRSPLLRKSNVSFSSSPYLDVSVQEVPGLILFYSDKVDRSLSCQVSPFRNLRVNGYLLLTAAYRSLSRLSSALSAKASTLRSFLLIQLSKHRIRTVDCSQAYRFGCRCFREAPLHEQKESSKAAILRMQVG